MNQRFNPPGRRRKAASKPPSHARLWWLIHQWSGLKLSLILTFIMFTGSLAVLSHELDWLLQPSLRVNPASVDGPIAWDLIVANAYRYPGTAQALNVTAPVASAFAARVMVERTDGTIAMLNAHPSSGVIQGHSSSHSAARILRQMHRHLYLPKWLGVPIVSAFSLSLLASLISSLVVYKKWWRGFFKPLRRRSARSWWGDFHRLAGLWSAWFLILIIVTGSWYLAESLGLRAEPTPTATVDAQTASLADPTDIADSLAAAKQAFPDLIIRHIKLPSADHPILILHGDYKAILVRPRANSIAVDHRTGAILLTTDGRQLGLHQRISEMADPLHFGTFGGYWTKLIWFVGGLTLTALALSGAAIHTLRLNRSRERPITIGQPLAGLWSGMGWLRWPAAALITAAFLLLALSIFSAST